MRSIRLCVGEGNGIDQACLMTASNMLIGRGADKDRATEANCICSILRPFIIGTNDIIGRFSSSLLAELYTPLIYELPGTHSADLSVRLRRAHKLVDWVVRQVIPFALRSRGVDNYDRMLEELPEIVDAETANKAFACVANVTSRLGVSSLADAVIHAGIASSGLVEVSSRYAVVECVRVVGAAITAVYTTTEAEEICRMCPEIIREVIAIGDKRPVEAVLTEDDLCQKLGTV